MKHLTHYLKDLESRLTDEEKELIKDGISFLLQVCAVFAFIFLSLFSIILFAL